MKARLQGSRCPPAVAGWPDPPGPAPPPPRRRTVPAASFPPERRVVRPIVGWPRRRMWTVNKVLLTGRLTRDPEMRSLASGKAVTQFSVATNEYAANGKERAEYHNVVT